MRADVHEGREHMLQSEAGYIDARPHRQDRGNLLHRTAGPYIRVKTGGEFGIQCCQNIVPRQTTRRAMGGGRKDPACPRRPPSRPQCTAIGATVEPVAPSSLSGVITKANS